MPIFVLNPITASEYQSWRAFNSPTQTPSASAHWPAVNFLQSHVNAVRLIQTNDFSCGRCRIALNFHEQSSKNSEIFLCLSDTSYSVKNKKRFLNGSWLGHTVLRVNIWRTHIMEKWIFLTFFNVVCKYQILQEYYVSKHTVVFSYWLAVYPCLLNNESIRTLSTCSAFWMR